jgi:hypothetical protein
MKLRFMAAFFTFRLRISFPGIEGLGCHDTFSVDANDFLSD